MVVSRRKRVEEKDSNRVISNFQKKFKLSTCMQTGVGYACMGRVSVGGFNEACVRIWEHAFELTFLRAPSRAPHVLRYRRFTRPPKHGRFLLLMVRKFWV